MTDERKNYPLDVQLLEAVLDYLPIGAILLDDEGIIQRFNRYEEQLSGRKREKTIGKSFFSDVAPCTEDIELGPRFREGIEKGNLDLDVEFSFPYPYNRVPRDVHIRAASVKGGNQQAHVVLIEDITSRRQLQQNNADMMLGLKSMLVKWRGGQTSIAGKNHLAIGSNESFEHQAIVLYADVSGFEELARRTPPAKLFQVVDHQLKTAIEIITRRGGQIDQVNGNGVLGIFLAKEHGERSYHDAIRAAHEIVTDRHKDLKLPFRVGLATGPIYNGPIGHAELSNRATVGAPISMARALSHTGRPEEVILTEDLVGRVGEVITAAALPGVSPMGVADPGTIYRLEHIDLPVHG